MALTKRFLRTLGIDEDKVEEIMNGHAESLEALRSERDRYQKDAEALAEVQKKLSDAEEKVKELTEATKGSADFEKKYTDLKKEYEEFKTGKEKEAQEAKVRNAYRALLKNAGVSEKRLDTVLKVSDLSAVKLDKDGNIEGADALTETIKKDWSDFITTLGTEGAKTATPPKNEGGAVKTREEIMQIKDTQERQKAWSDYIRNGGK